MPARIPLVHPGQPIRADDFNRLVGEVNRGVNFTVAPPLVIYNGASGPVVRWQKPFDRCRFKLTAALTAGGNASAVYRIFDGSTWVDDTDTLTVYDAEGDKTGSSGMHGRAEYMDDSGRWEIYYLEC